MGILVNDMIAPFMSIVLNKKNIIKPEKNINITVPNIINTYLNLQYFGFGVFIIVQKRWTL